MDDHQKYILDSVRRHCFDFLSFLGDNLRDSRETWQEKIDERIQSIIEKELIPGIVSCGQDKISLSPIYSLFSVLFILVSEEFDAGMDALVDDDWSKFDKLYSHLKDYSLQSKKWEIQKWRKLEDIARLLSTNWENYKKLGNEAPVRELEFWEKKLFLEENYQLPRTPAPWQKEGEELFDRENRRWYTANCRIHLSIDLFTPVDVVTKMVKEIITQRQADYLEGLKEELQSEIKSGWRADIDIKEDIEQEKLRYDFKRSTNKNKKSRGVTTLEHWLRYLQCYYYCERQGMKPKVAGNQKWFKSAGIVGDIDSTVSRDKGKARLLICSALNGRPLAFVKT